jgi:hypothetical protein
VTGQIFSAHCAVPVSMRATSADRAAGPRGRQGSMRHEHTTSPARCEIARDKPGAHPGQTCSARRLAATSRSLTMAANLSVPFARAVVIGRTRGLDGQIQADVLYLPVYSAPTSDHRCAHKRYRALSHYVAATFIGALFSIGPPISVTVCSV